MSTVKLLSVSSMLEFFKQTKRKLNTNQGDKGLTSRSHMYVGHNVSLSVCQICCNRVKLDRDMQQGLHFYYSSKCILCAC